MLQILGAKQNATAIVYAYPYTPKHELMLEELAASKGEPSTQSLLEDTSIDDIQHAAHWEQIKQYLTIITMENVSEHVPLLPR